MSDYLDKLESEIQNELTNASLSMPVRQAVEMVDDKELETIIDMENKLGVKYSDEQKKILKHKGNVCILACAGSGKALVNGTKVLTPSGYVNIECLQVGDNVFDEQGEIQEVKGVYPQGEKRVWRVLFSDGSVINCCSEHLWSVYVGKKKLKRDKLRVYSTSQLQELLHKKIYISKQTSNISVYEDILTNLILQCTYSKSLKDVFQDMQSDLKANGCNAFKNWHGPILTMLEGIVQILSSYKHRIIVGEQTGKVLKLVSEFMGIDMRIESLSGDDSKCLIKLHSADKPRHILEIFDTQEKAEMTCIEVTGSSKLYITEHCIPTHNTTVSTHMIAKRIKTGEIRDVNKLIYTTYSKKGQLEMKERLDSVLKSLGMNYNIQVRTLHSFFLQILRMFGVDSDIIKERDRSRLIKEACTEAGYYTKDDDLMIIDNLLSYQINNLMSDASLIDCHLNTLEDLKLEQYSLIRSKYAYKKWNFGADGKGVGSRDRNGKIKHVIDYDDMQSYLYLWLCKDINSDEPEKVKQSIMIRDYCQSLWNDFYIDEAQDVSKMQFEILKALITRPEDPYKLVSNLAFIGDDDQCLIAGTDIITNEGIKPIEDINIGDMVLSGRGYSNTKYARVNNIAKKQYSGDIYVITTKSGKKLKGTGTHLAWVKDTSENRNGGASWSEVGNCGGDGSETGSGDANRVVEIVDTLFNGIKSEDARVNEIIHETPSITAHRLEESCAELGIYTVLDTKVQFTESIFTPIRFNQLTIGATIPVFNYDDLSVSNDTIEKIEIEQYSGYVYDLSVPETLNFIANRILVHNCIYEWRGSDPNIIINIGTMFNMPTYVLSTNYRCKSHIVDYATRGIKCNNHRYTKGMQAYNDGGTVKIVQSEKEDLCSLSILALQHIKYWVSNGVDVKNIAVLCRNNSHLAILSNMLLREGIYCEQTEDMKLTNSYLYKDFKNLIALSDTCFKHEVTSAIIWKLCSYMKTQDARVIANFQDASALTTADTIGYILGKMLCRVEFNKHININEQACERLRYYVSRFSAATIDDLINVYTILSSPSDKSEKFKALTYIYLNAASYLYKTADLRRSLNGTSIYFLNLLKKDGFDGMVQFLRVTEQYESGQVGIIGNKLTLSTIHSAKGREWKNVIMFACDNVSEPSLDSINKMVNDGTSEPDIYDRIDEERRLFYVGNTRAKENLLVITYTIPSVFIMEALGMFGDKGNDSRIVEYAKDPVMIKTYEDDIKDILQNPASEYYYNKTEYVTG